MPTITKIQLSDGSVYGIFDVNSLHLDANGRLITGNELVDRMVIQGHLYVTEIDDVPVNQYIDNVLVQDGATGLIKKRSTEILLHDIGGTAHQMNEETHTLSVQVGKFE